MKLFLWLSAVVQVALSGSIAHTAIHPAGGITYAHPHEAAPVIGLRAGPAHAVAYSGGSPVQYTNVQSIAYTSPNLNYVREKHFCFKFEFSQ